MTKVKGIKETINDLQAQMKFDKMRFEQQLALEKMRFEQKKLELERTLALHNK